MEKIFDRLRCLIVRVFFFFFFFCGVGIGVGGAAAGGGGGAGRCWLPFLPVYSTLSLLFVSHHLPQNNNPQPPTNV